jgi:hypothetical protein
VAICYCRQKLLYDNRGIIFIESLSRDNFIEKLSSLAVFRDKIYVLLVFENLIESKDIRMIKVLENIDFIIESDASMRRHLLFDKPFHSPLFPCCFVDTLLHHAEAALSEYFVSFNLIVLEKFALSMLDNEVTLVNYHFVHVVDCALLHHRLKFLKY